MEAVALAARRHHFGTADFFFEGARPAARGAGPERHAPGIDQPGNTGNWGLSARLNAEAIESTVGLYYRKFNDYQPWFAPSAASCSWRRAWWCPPASSSSIRRTCPSSVEPGPRIGPVSGAPNCRTTRTVR
jgi:hypothetical protein